MNIGKFIENHQDNYSKKMKFVHPMIEYINSSGLIHNHSVIPTICTNPNISIDFIEEQEYYKNALGYILRNPNLTASFIRKYSLLCNPNMDSTVYLRYSNIFTADIIVKLNTDSSMSNIFNRTLTNENLDSMSIDKILKSNKSIMFEHLCQNPNIKLDHVRPFLNEILNKGPTFLIHLLKSRNITWEDTKEIVKRLPEYVSSLARELTVHVSLIFDNKENDDDLDSIKNYAYFFFSSNENINIDIIKNNSDIVWDWVQLSMNPSISLSDMLENRDLPWEWDYVVSNPSVSVKEIMEYTDIFTDLSRLVSNPNINMDDLRSLVRTTFFIPHLCSNMFCHHPYYRSDKYKRILVKKFFDICMHDIIEKACDCKRLFSWNDGMVEELPEEYEKECKRYSDMFSSIEKRDAVVVVEIEQS